MKKQLVRRMTCVLLFLFMLAGLITALPLFDAIDGENDIGETVDAAGTTFSTKSENLTEHGECKVKTISVDSASGATCTTDTGAQTIGVAYNGASIGNSAPSISSTCGIAGFGYSANSTAGRKIVVKIDLGQTLWLTQLKIYDIVKQGTSSWNHGLFFITSDTVKHSTSSTTTYAKATSLSCSISGGTTETVTVNGSSRKCYSGDVTLNCTDVKTRYIFVTAYIGSVWCGGFSEITATCYKIYNVTLNGDGATTAGTTSVEAKHGIGMPSITTPKKRVILSAAILRLPAEAERSIIMMTARAREIGTKHRILHYMPNGRLILTL